MQTLAMSGIKVGGSDLAEDRYRMSVDLLAEGTSFWRS